MSSSNSSRKRISKLESSDSPSSYEIVKKPKLELDKDILREQTAFGLRLANQVFSNLKTKNVVLSPLSIHIALSMVAAGAAGLENEKIVSFLGAKSEEQLRNFVSTVTDVILSEHSSCSHMGFSPKLRAANAVWLNDSLTFKSAFKQAMKTDYKAVTKLLDFTKVDEAVQEVNEWAEKATDGLIKGIVNSDSFDNGNEITVLVLANALYFHGSWEEKFWPQCTEFDDFHHMDGSSSSVRVPFMCKNKGWARIATYDTFKVLNLPYFRDKRSFSMSIFLPNDRHGLPSLLQRVCTHDFLDLHIPKEEVAFRNLRIPKFKIEADFNVKDVLEQLGLKIGVLTEVVEETMEPPVKVSNIAQKAFVEVDENGTKVAAVTYVRLRGGGSFPDVDLDFIANHPFMFVIRENITGLVLFVGRVLNPSS